MVEYFAKCFGYALVQNRNDAEGLKQSLRAIIPHAFGKHKYCSVTWCGFLKDLSSYCHVSLLHGNNLKGDKMEEELTNSLTCSYRMQKNLLHSVPARLMRL